MASGDTMYTCLPQGSIPTTTVAATPDFIADGSTVAGQIPVLDYAGATADEHREWAFQVPSEYDGGGFDFVPKYAMDGTDGSAVQFEIRMIQMVDADVITSQDLQAQTATDATDTPIGTANAFNVVAAVAITHANAGSPAVGDYVRVRISRDYDHAANADDLQFISCLITET